jgi:hypothetical protein
MARIVIPTPATATSNPKISAVPTCEVEWAPWSVPNDAPSWTRLVGRVKGAATQRGRPRELDRFQMGRAGVALDNLDRAFDPNFSAGPYYGSIRPERQLRLTAIAPDGSKYPIITTYLDGFPQLTDWSTLLATVAASGGDLFKLLAQAPLPTSMLEMIVAQDLPTHWWHLDEISTATTAIDVGFGGTPSPGTYVNATPSAQATPVPFDGGRSGPSFALNGYVLLPKSAVVVGPKFTVEAWINWPVAVTGSGILFGQSNKTAPSTDAISLQAGSVAVSSGKSFFGVGSTSISGGTSTTDGKAHHLMGTYDGTTGILYVDGVQVATGAMTYVYDANAISMIGNQAYVSGNQTPGPVTSVAIYDGKVLTAQNALDRYNAGKTAFSGDGTGTRVGRVLDFIGFPPALRSIQTGSSTLGSYDLPGGKVLDYLQTLAVTEQGQFYVDRSGILTWRQRSDLLTAARTTTSQCTFGDSGEAYHSVTATRTATSVNLTAISPVLTAADVGALVVGPGIPAGTVIATQAGASATMSTAATSSTTGAVNLGEVPYLRAEPAFDETRLWNDITIGRQGGAPQRVTDQASIRQHGQLGLPPDTTRLYADDNQSNDMANWTLTHNSQPQQRMVEIEFSLNDPVVIAQVLSREIGDRVTVVRRPQMALTSAAIQQDLIVQAINHTQIIPGSWHVVIQLSAAETQQYWVLGDSVLSVCGSTTRVAA